MSVDNGSLVRASDSSTCSNCIQVLGEVDARNTLPVIRRTFLSSSFLSKNADILIYDLGGASSSYLSYLSIFSRVYGKPHWRLSSREYGTLLFSLWEPVSVSSESVLELSRLHLQA
jgi:hypothetical protein